MSKPTTVAEYLKTVPTERLSAFKKLRKTINTHIDKGFKECINYNMLGWVVPHKTYPEGYHCKPELPVPFANLANQKGFIGVYHMGMYADKEILDWFVEEYPKHCKYKLDMGKSCIRFKKMEDIPYDLVGELMAKMSLKRWIEVYEKNIKK